MDFDAARSDVHALVGENGAGKSTLVRIPAGAVRPENGEIELDVIAAVVIGGGSLAGGEGSIAGALVGAFLMTEIKTGCTHIGLSAWVQEMIIGGIIVVAVALDRLRHRRME